MITITDQDGAAKAKYELECALFDGESRQLYAGDTLITTLRRGNYELSVEWGKLIFAWWNEEHSQNWRVTGYEAGRSEVRLRATRGILGEVVILVLRDPQRWSALQEIENLSLDQRRKSYARRLAELLTQHFEGARVRRITTGADRARSVPGRFARLSVQLGREEVFAIGVNDAESQADVDGVIAAGLVWLAHANEDCEPKRRVRRLWFCLPSGRSQTALERLSLIDISHLDARIECFEVDERQEELIGARPSTQGELLNTHPRELRWLTESNRSERWRARILNLAPGMVEARDHSGHQAGHQGESFCINGLEFARVSAGEQMEVKFGVAGMHAGDRLSNLTELDESNFKELQLLVGEIVKYRSSDSPDRRHPFYRLRAESWLESLLRRDICVLDATLDDRFVYSQIPAWRAEERSVIDLLTINQEARLAIIELKIAEDPQLPLQGLDYWLRVEQARLRGEFERRGMFTGVKIADRSPLLYLVAPRLRFHRTFAAVARCLAPQIEAYRIGINANWRAGVRAHSCERIN